VGLTSDTILPGKAFQWVSSKWLKERPCEVILATSSPCRPAVTYLFIFLSPKWIDFQAGKARTGEWKKENERASYDGSIGTNKLGETRDFAIQTHFSLRSRLAYKSRCNQSACCVLLEASDCVQKAVIPPTSQFNSKMKHDLDWHAEVKGKHM
jgi:hypothetical protein